MFLLGEFVKSEYPTCNEIVLAVNHKNIPAQKLYSKVGYKDTGRRKMGPIGEQFIMNLLLYRKRIMEINKGAYATVGTGTSWYCRLGQGTCPRGQTNHSSEKRRVVILYEQNYRILLEKY
jgi:hypothetical protein